MNQKKTKTRNKQYVDQNPVEALRSIGAGIVGSFTKDVAQKGSSDFLKQLLDTERKQKSKKPLEGDLVEGEEIDLSQVSRKETPLPNIEPGIDYGRGIVQGDKRIAHQDTRAIEIKIKEILIELKRISSSSKEIAIQFKEVVVEQRITNPGKYHESFFSWILTSIKSARARIEDAGAWLTMFKSKKAQKRYWNQFKKHGTSFGLSNERVVATQTG